jgi:hypothetical protein
VNPQLNESFIEIVENIHMKQRMMGVSFSIKMRESKNKYIDSNLKNVLLELSADLVNYGSDIVLRKLLITSILEFIDKFYEKIIRSNKG